MSNQVTIILQPDGDVSIEWGGDLDGVCCGPEEKKLINKLAELGVELETKNVVCHLPEPRMRLAQLAGICNKKETV